MNTKLSRRAATWFSLIMLIIVGASFAQGDQYHCESNMAFTGYHAAKKMRTANYPVKHTSRDSTFSKKHCTNNNSIKKSYLTYLRSLAGNGALSGHFIRWNYNASLNEINEIHDSSGQWVAMLGADYYSNFQDSLPAPPCNYTLTNSILIAYLKKNGLVNLSVHIVNPQTGGSAWNNTIDFDSLFVEGSRVQRNFYTQLDSIAMGLLQLKKAGITTMFRPFHEMNGGWFWWGNQPRYRELWIMTHNYLTKTKKLNNLIWCWSPNTGSRIMDFYPGDAFVDVVGLDAYTPELPSVAKTNYKELLKLEKPFGFTEYGCVAGGDKTAGDFDFALLGEWLKNDFPQAVFFLTWRDHWGMAKNKGTDNLLNDKYIINKDLAK